MVREKMNSNYKKYLALYGLEEVPLQNVQQISFDKNEIMCAEGNPMQYIFIMVEGVAKVCITSANGKSLLLCFYKENGILGDMELMWGSEKASTSVRAITKTTCIAIPYMQNKKILKSSLTFLNSIGYELAKKLDRCSKNSAMIILHSLEARLCAYIYMTNENGYFKEKNTELAELLGTSYRHLLRTLEKLLEEGVIEKSGSGYVIKERDKLYEKGLDCYTIT